MYLRLLVWYVRPANLMPDKLAEPNQDRSAVSQGATGCNFWDPYRVITRQKDKEL